jgi:hypothetical protein
MCDIVLNFMVDLMDTENFMQTTADVRTIESPSPIVPGTVTPQHAPASAGDPATAEPSVQARHEPSPYRFVRASQWLVQGLLKYHYLPYWPVNTSDVFAAVHVPTCQVVAATVFAYPVLRCGLRESVFGKLPPEAINQHFRQLVRWVVHPDHRTQGVGHKLLKWSFTRMDVPVVEAINRKWVPSEVFDDCGMIHREDNARHYYYRLKECRKRVDETLAVPVQPEPLEEGMCHKYPRVWEPDALRKAAMQGNRIYHVQAYAGALISTHYVKGDGGYVAFYHEDVTLAMLERGAGGGWVEVTDDAARAKLLAAPAHRFVIPN